MVIPISENKELEVKFLVSDLKIVEKRLASLGATLVQPRTHEYNLRFDTPAGQLTEAMSVLRLRRDNRSHLTYKGPSVTLGGVLSRTELEFEVSDFSAAQKLVEALGFNSKFIYEKQRTTYDYKGLKVTLDEMPYGNFTEIEGPDAPSIQEASQKLNLNWERRLPETYISIFRRLRELFSLSFQDLTFDNFQGVSVDLSRVGMLPADEAS
ncbi:MAG: class IV adenylate cyclase [Chloroflexi bacterium]|nr:class IV adenylate cyclase [Chloroflexota bacterium]